MTSCTSSNPIRDFLAIKGTRRGGSRHNLLFMTRYILINKINDNFIITIIRLKRTQRLIHKGRGCFISHCRGNRKTMFGRKRVFFDVDNRKRFQPIAFNGPIHCAPAHCINIERSLVAIDFRRHVYGIIITVL